MPHGIPSYAKCPYMSPGSEIRKIIVMMGKQLFGDEADA